MTVPSPSENNKPTIANLRREHLERLLGYTPEQGGKFSYNDLVYQYSQMPAFETDDYSGSIVGGFSVHELGALQATLDDWQKGQDATDAAGYAESQSLSDEQATNR